MTSIVVVQYKREENTFLCVCVCDVCVIVCVCESVCVSVCVCNCVVEALQGSSVKKRGL